MAAPTFTLAETNTSAATVTNSVPTIAHASADAASTTTLSGANPVAAGNNGFEKWQRLLLTAAAPNSISGFSVYWSATAPTDAGGGANVSAFYSTNNVFATPVATTSTVATTSIASATAAPGTVGVTAPANTAGSFSGYIIEQVRIAAAAVGGNVVFATPYRTVAYSYA